jgi:quercetin dioxygenase-like cupin family protein
MSVNSLVNDRVPFHPVAPIPERHTAFWKASLAPGMVVPRHTHTREDETYHVVSGELEVIVGEEVFVLKEGDALMAPRGIPHQLRNSGNAENHYLLVFSPSGIENFFRAMAVPAPNDAAAPTKPPVVAVQNSRSSQPNTEFLPVEWWGHAQAGHAVARLGL